MADGIPLHLSELEDLPGPVRAGNFSSQHSGQIHDTLHQTLVGGQFSATIVDTVFQTDARVATHYDRMGVHRQVGYADAGFVTFL